VNDNYDCVVEKIPVATGVVSFVAGAPGQKGSTDGVGSAARFFYPRGIGLDGAGNLAVADTGNSTVRRISLASGAVSTVAGAVKVYGYRDGVGSAANFNGVTDVASDGSGHTFATDSSNHVIRKIVDATGEVTTFAGVGGVSGTADGVGSAARLENPEGITFDGVGSLFVADGGNHTIRRVDLATAEVTTVGGQARYVGGADGPGATARFNLPVGIAVDAGGTLYVSEESGNCIRKGSLTLPDAAMIDAPSGRVGVTRQLSTSPSTATSWKWEVIRRPAGSVALLSSDTEREPTFTPDRPDLYVVRLTATSGSRLSITTVELMALAARQRRHLQ
jgi:hypothetical protein